jgi:hypothetical protein
MQKIVIATRESQLALWQAHHVRDRLMALHPGDAVVDRPSGRRGEGRFELGEPGRPVLLDQKGRVVLQDPAEDLGWLCVRAWRFGSDLPVGGIGQREELLAAYQAAGGAPVDLERVRFWEVFGNLKWAVICIAQAKTHLDGLVKSVELASLGRRTAETELELLELIA